MPIDLTPFAEGINNALTEGTFCVLATCGDDGPDVGFKGSLQVFDDQHLCYWERTRSGHLANLRSDPGVAVMYFSGQRGSTSECTAAPNCTKTARHASRSWRGHPLLN